MRDLNRLKCSAAAVALFAAALWILLGYGVLLPFDLVQTLGIYPRETATLSGILTAPLMHSSIGHLAANTVPLFVLGTAMLYSLPRAASVALPAIWLLSGLGVWLFGRPSFHIGISGVTHGMLFFMLLIGVLRRDRASVALTMIVTFLYGGMIWGVLPQGPHISFESHLFGALTGLAAAAALRNADPLTSRRLFEPAAVPACEADDPVIGDQWRAVLPPEARDRD